MNSLLRKIALLLSLCFAVVATGCATQGTSLGTKIDDTIITTKVKAALFDDPAVRGTAVKVKTVEGVVQLSGFVGSQAEANRAVELARGVENVNNVLNQMTIKP